MKFILYFLGFLWVNCTLAQDKNIVSIYFNSGDAKFTKAAKTKIDSLLNTAVSGEFFITKIIAYCDRTGSLELNTQLAKNRLNTVVNYISVKSIPITETVAAGTNYPENAQNTANLSFWRRVDIEYIIEPAIRVVPDIPFSENKFSSLSIDNLAEDEIISIVLDIQFMPGLDAFMPTSLPEIQRLFDFMNANPNAFAFIRGHVCCDNDYTLTALRAYAVYKQLVDRGISPSRLKYQGFSNTIPAVSPEIDEESRQKNRRVDVEFSKIQKSE
jgi:outer membrane protein OmpA-like peptidoglycan-associated protein